MRRATRIAKRCFLTLSRVRLRSGFSVLLNHLLEGIEMMNCYERRDKTIRSIGFSSYRSYLKSSLWKRIRRKVLDRSNDLCEVCGKDANQVHHRSYTREVLLGNNLTWLTAVCDDCHVSAEFDGDRKRTVTKTNHVMNKSTWGSGRRVRGQCVNCKKNPTKKGNLICGRCAMEAAESQ